MIRTVRGDIDPPALGITNAHEHVIIRNGLILVREPEFRLDDCQKAVQELNDFHACGGRALVDCAPISVGRDPNALRDISEQTGVHIIAATGFHKTRYYLDSHWRFRYSAEQIADLLVDEIELGMEQNSYEGPIENRSSAQAGVIKVASDYQLIDPPTRIAFQAAAMAHRRTGAPILTHTEMGTMALEQVKLLESLGADPQHIVLSHVDRNPDPHVHQEAAKLGAFLEYDGPGRIKYGPESSLINLIRSMFDAGLGHKVTLGGDTARRSYWKAYGGGPGIAYTLEHFVPRLRSSGFSQAEVDLILLQNPARLFDFASVT